MPKSFTQTSFQGVCQSVVTFVSVQMWDRKPLNKQEPYLFTTHINIEQALLFRECSDIKWISLSSHVNQEAIMKTEITEQTENVNYISDHQCQYGSATKGQVVGPQEDSMILSKNSLPKIEELIKTFISHNCNTCGKLVGFSDAKVRNQIFFITYSTLLSRLSGSLFII